MTKHYKAGKVAKEAGKKATDNPCVYERHYNEWNDGFKGLEIGTTKMEQKTKYRI